MADEKHNFLFSRVTGRLSEFQGCLADSRGQELRFDPDNEKAPPHGAGVQLTYKALANHEAELQKLPPNKEKKNRPIPVNDVDNFARLFCLEYTKKNKNFKVSTADSSSILNIVAKASCFTSDVRTLAVKIRDNVSLMLQEMYSFI